MSIRDEPFYPLPAGEFAAWIEQQGGVTWWNDETAQSSNDRVGTRLAELLTTLSAS